MNSPLGRKRARPLLARLAALLFALAAGELGAQAAFPKLIAEGQLLPAEVREGEKAVFVPLPYYDDGGELFPIERAAPTRELAALFPQLEGRTLDLARGEEIIVLNGETGEAEAWTIRGGYQLPDSSFGEWHTERVTGFISIGTRECSEMAGRDASSVWDNGNPAYAATGSRNWPTRRVVLADGSVAAELVTRKAFGVIASGNLFTGRIIRNLSLSELLASTKKDGKELISWGAPFKARPRAIRVKFKYDGLGDTCTISARLENHSQETRRYVGVAWYNSDTDNDTGVEGVISISEPDANGLRVLETAFIYGRPHEAADALPADAAYGAGDEDVTHVTVVFASSARGDWFEGVENARLIVKDFEFVY